MRVLLIDDDKTIARVATLSLEKKGGHEVAAASNGTEGIAFAREKTPDLILLDVMMPGMDGYETCRRLREDPRTRNIPVIFLSANDDPEEATKGLALGAVGYLRKPFNPLTLSDQIGEILA